MFYQEDDYNLSFIDFLFAIIAILSVVFLLSIALITSKKEELKANVSMNAEMIITTKWDDKIDCDVDLWIIDPYKNIVSFKTTDAGLMHLERDDRGYVSDKFIGEDNREFLFSENKEYVVMRGFIEGEYTISIHLYSCAHSVVKSPETNILERHGLPVNIPVTIELYQVNPVYVKMLSKEIVFTRTWEERTVWRVTFDKNKKIIDINESEKPFIVKQNSGDPTAN